MYETVTRKHYISCFSSLFYISTAHLDLKDDFIIREPPESDVCDWVVCTGLKKAMDRVPWANTADDTLFCHVSI